jgi:hypothetical protein
LKDVIIVDIGVDHSQRSVTSSVTRVVPETNAIRIVDTDVPVDFNARTRQDFDAPICREVTKCRINTVSSQYVVADDRGVANLVEDTGAEIVFDGVVSYRTSTLLMSVQSPAP